MIGWLMMTTAAEAVGPTIGIQIVGVEQHWNRVAEWDEPLIGATGEDVRWRRLALPFARLYGGIPDGPFLVDVNFGGLTTYIAQPIVPLEFDPPGERASKGYDIQAFRFHLGPCACSEAAGIGVTVGYESGFAGVVHEEVMSSAAGNAMYGALGAKLGGYVALGEQIGLHTSVGTDLVMTRGGGFADGYAISVDEYIYLVLFEGGQGLYLHPGYRFRSAYIAYDKEQKQRMTTWTLGGGVLF